MKGVLGGWCSVLVLGDVLVLGGGVVVTVAVVTGRDSPLGFCSSVVTRKKETGTADVKLEARLGVGRRAHTRFGQLHARLL